MTPLAPFSLNLQLHFFLVKTSGPMELGVSRKNGAGGFQKNGARVSSYTTPMQYTPIFHGCKNDNFQMKNCDNFLIIAQNKDCWYTVLTSTQNLCLEQNKKMYTPANARFYYVKMGCNAVFSTQTCWYDAKKCTVSRQYSGGPPSVHPSVHHRLSIIVCQGNTICAINRQRFESYADTISKTCRRYF